MILNDKQFPEFWLTGYNTLFRKNDDNNYWLETVKRG